LFWRVIAVAKTIRELPGGLVSERLCLGEISKRPAPGEEISAPASRPELREVHGKRNKLESSADKDFRQAKARKRALLMVEFSLYRIGNETCQFSRKRAKNCD
jgi:hypothetical protein